MLYLNMFNRIIFQFIYVILASNVVYASDVDTIVVAKNNKGNYSTIQNAFNAIPCNSIGKTVILIKKGIYNEKAELFPTKRKVVFIGQDIDSTIIRYNDYSGKIISNDTLTTHNSYSLRILSDNIVVKNLTIENYAGTIAQAVAVEIKGDKVSFWNCKLLGNQDTFYANSDGRIYLNNCYIEGTIDFIFGKSIVLFDSCTIKSKKNSYITAASTTEGTQYGFVFKNCKLIANAGINKVFLGRPWRSFAKTVFINCYMGNQIVKEGWNNWSNPEKQKTIYYGEYLSNGPGAINISSRVSWSHQLTIQEVMQYTLKNIFSKRASNINFADNWIPLNL
jgi:pectinesterase